MPVAPLVILNPVAGDGRAGRLASWLRHRLRGISDADLVETLAPGHAEELARQAVAQGRHRVVAVGGDGTLQEIANGLVDGASRDSIPSLGIVPRGSGNDLARSMGLARAIDDAWAVAIGDRTSAVDTLEAIADDGRRRLFVSAGGVGFDAEVAAIVARRERRRRGRLAYLLTALAELRRYRNRALRLTLDGQALPERRLLLVAFANGAYYGGGMRICPDATVDDGLIDVCIVGDLSHAAALRQIPALYRGTHVRHPQIEMRRVRSIRIEGEPGALSHLDGEPFGALPISIRVASAALHVAR